MSTSTESRPARHAGTFYESDPVRLRREIQQYIDQAELPEFTRTPVGFVAPHAGYAYSGPTAGHVYRILREMQPERIFVLAPSHHAALRMASAWNGNAYETPLGAYPIDTEMVGALRRANEGIVFEAFAETQEHALEVQVPFLQVACPDAQMIPLIIGTHHTDALKDLTEAIVSVCRASGYLERGRVAFIASSDGYHGYSLDELEASDTRLAAAMQNMDQKALFEPTPDGHPRACGVAAISVVIQIAQELSAREVTILNRSSSADFVGHRAGQWTVGYIAAAMV